MHCDARRHGHEWAGFLQLQRCGAGSEPAGRCVAPGRLAHNRGAEIASGAPARRPPACRGGRSVSTPHGQRCVRVRSDKALDEIDGGGDPGAREIGK